MYLGDRALFESTAKFWTQCYALPAGESGAEVDSFEIFKIIFALFKNPSKIQVGSEAIRRLVDMGFPEADARTALVNNNWDENAAVNALVSAM